MQNITRRGFVSAAGAAVATGALAGVATAAEANAIEWAYETDVVVIGYGGAGAAAAIEAFDAGAQVIVLEKHEFGGGNTELSGGTFIDVKDPEAACKYLVAYHSQNYSECCPDIIRAFCDASVGMEEWVGDLAGDGFREAAATMPWFEGSESIVKPSVLAVDFKNGGAQLFHALATNVEDVRGIQVMLNTPAVKLIARDGEVIGVVAQGPEGRFNVKARKAVIIGAGSYENDERSKQNIFPCQTAVLGTPANTGDGIRLAQMLGADIWHLNGQGGCAWGMKCGDYLTDAWVAIRNGSFIWTDCDGNRFYNEYGMESHSSLIEAGKFDSATLRHPTAPMFTVFDDKLRAAGPVAMPNMGYFILHEYQWSRDNLAEIEAGWIVKGDTIEELAEKLGTPDLAATVAAWNEACAGAEDKLGRAASADQALDTPPFYAIETYPAVLGMQAGTRRNTKCQAMNVEGNPIPRLYSVGECGSAWGSMFEPGVAVGEALATGRIAGREAGVLPSWE